MSEPITVDMVLDSARARAAALGVDLIMPGDVRREAVVYSLGAWHRLRGGSAAWDVGYARENVSVTVPAAGPALDLLASIPVAGEVFKALGAATTRPAIYLATGAMRDARTCHSVLGHEFGHIDRLRKGGLLWCVAYGVAPEARGADEAACYGSDLAGAAVYGGPYETDHELSARVYGAAIACGRSLERYDLDPPSLETATAILQVHARSLAAGAIPGGPFADILLDLAERGGDVPGRWLLAARGSR